jgi:periplasmic protein TonB
MVLRFPIAALLGLILTGSMFWFLWALITGGQGAINLVPAVRIDFTPLRHDTATESKRDRVERPKPQQVPEMPDMARTAFDAGENNANFNMNVGTEVSMGGIQVSGGSDRDIMPLVRINPDYPRRALSRGITGWVQFEFTITPAGTVSNVKVIDADPKGIFEEAATKAILRWKYNPKVEEGRAVERRGVRVVLRFDLED